MFLLEWIDIFGMVPVALKLFPILEQIKDSILCGHFEEARKKAEDVLALLGKLNEATDREFRSRAWRE